MTKAAITIVKAPVTFTCPAPLKASVSVGVRPDALCVGTTIGPVPVGRVELVP